jgi:hypothetical protein
MPFDFSARGELVLPSARLWNLLGMVVGTVVDVVVGVCDGTFLGLSCLCWFDRWLFCGNLRGYCRWALNSAEVGLL